MPGLSLARRQSLALLVSQAVLILGAALRLIEYLTNRPLSIDESFLALNVLEKSPRDLLHALDFNQAAPLGFLQVEKLSTTLLGRSEYALRLVPLLASLASLFFFYAAARNLLPRVAVPLACAAFAVLDPLIYYGATAKQYSLDVAAAVILYAIAVRASADGLRRGDLVRLAALGAVVLWFSHPAAFVLAAIGITLSAQIVRREAWGHLLGLGLTATAWLVSFGLELRLSRSNLSRIEQSFHGSDHVLTIPAGGSSWFDSATGRLRYLVGLEDTASGSPILGSLPAAVNQGLTVLLCLVTALGLAALVMRRPRSAMLLVIPPILAIVASALHKYPLVGRTLLFLLPSVALCIGEGFSALVSGIRSMAAPIGIALTAISLISFGLLPAVHLVQPRAGEGIRPALRDLGRDYERGDALYLGHEAQYGLVYYHLCGCAGFDPAKGWPFALAGGPSAGEPAMTSLTPRLVVGSPDFGGSSLPDVRSLVGMRRVWILISETPERELRSFLSSLSSFGRQLRAYGTYGVRDNGAALYLYDLGASRRLAEPGVRP